VRCLMSAPGRPPRPPVNQMTLLRIDLYLGSDVGKWVLDQIEGRSVGRIVTLDAHIAHLAQDRGYVVSQGAPEALNFRPAEVGFSIHYPRVFSPRFLVRYRKMYNLHPGYLPWGRGYYPVFWALWERVPAGATLHEITASIDGGPIVAQERVAYSAADTGGVLHGCVREAEHRLFLQYWPRVAAGESLPSVPQAGTGTYHSKREFFELQKNAAWDSMSGPELVRLLRAMAFPGYPGLEITLAGRKFELRLEQLPGTVI